MLCNVIASFVAHLTDSNENIF